MSELSSWSFYVSSSIAVTYGEMELLNGFVAVDPCHVLDLNSCDVKGALRELLLTNNLTVLKRGWKQGDEMLHNHENFLDLFGVKSERALAKKVKLLRIERNFGRFDITRYIGKSNGSFEGDPDGSLDIPKAIDLDQAVEFLVLEFQKVR